jgi:hypothetical protein
VAGLNDCALIIKDCQPNDDVLVRVKYWEIIADNLSKAGWSLGYISSVNCDGRTIWIADAHRDDGKRFVVRADEKVTAFVELELVIRDGQRVRCIALVRSSKSCPSPSPLLIHRPIYLDSVFPASSALECLPLGRRK